MAHGPIDTVLDLVEHRLDDRHSFFVGALPDALRLDGAGFDRLWALHPGDFHEIGYRCSNAVPSLAWINYRRQSIH